MITHPDAEDNDTRGVSLRGNGGQPVFLARRGPLPFLPPAAGRVCRFGYRVLRRIPLDPGPAMTPLGNAARSVRTTRPERTLCQGARRQGEGCHRDYRSLCSNKNVGLCSPTYKKYADGGGAGGVYCLKTQ